MRSLFVLPVLLLAAGCSRSPAAGQTAPCRTGRQVVVEWRGQGTVDVIWSTETLRTRYLPTDQAVEREEGLTEPGTFTFLGRATPGITRIDLPTDLRPGTVVVLLPSVGRHVNPPNSLRTRIEECAPPTSADSTQ